MPDFPTSFGNEVVDAAVRQYRNRMRRLAERALRGGITESEFRIQLARTTEQTMRAVFMLADGDMQDAAALRQLQEQIRISNRSTTFLATDIFDGRYSARSEEEAGTNRPVQTAAEGAAKLINRLSLWSFTMAGVYSMGRVYSAPITVRGQQYYRPLTWELGNTEQHCSSCIEQAGMTRSADEWRALGLWTQSSALACGGWRCDCRLV